MLRRRRLLLVLSVVLLGLVLSINYFSEGKYLKDQSAFSAQLEHHIGKVIHDFEKDFEKIQNSEVTDQQFFFSSLEIDHQFPFYLFSMEGDLAYWSAIDMVPEFSLLSTSKTYQILENNRGIYFTQLRKIKRIDKEYWLLQVYPFYDKVDIGNEYLKSGYNPEVFGNDRFLLSPNPKENYQDLYFDNQYLFSIFFRVGYDVPGKSINHTLLIFFFSLLGLVLLIGGGFVHTLWSKGQKFLATIYTFLILLAVRIIMLAFHFPNDFFQTGIFDSSLYASSIFNPSLGDLLLNVSCYLVVLSMIIAILSRRRVALAFIKFRNNYPDWLSLTAAYILSTTLMFLVFYLYLNIVENSQWNLNIEAIPNFDYLKIVSLFVIFLGGAAYLLFTIIGLNMVLFKNEDNYFYPLKVLVVFVSPFLIFLLFFNFVLFIAFLAHIILLVAIISFKLYQSLFKLDFNTFLTFFFACLIGAVITGAAAYQDLRYDEVRSKVKFANNVMLDRDVMGEFLLEDIIARVIDDAFIKSRLSDPLLSKDPIDRKIKKIYLAGYFDQYRQDVSIYSSSGRLVLGNNNSLSLLEYKNRYMNSDYATQIHNLYFIKSTDTNTGNRFVAFVKIQRDNDFLGTIVIELNQQRIESGKAFPKLLMDNKYVTNYIERDFDFAIFEEEELSYSSGIFSYQGLPIEDFLDNENVFTTGILYNGYHHLAVSYNDKIIVVSSRKYPSNYILADIAFLFVVYLIFTLLSIAVFLMFSGLNQLRFNYATKLQLYLNFAFFFPMLIISVIAVGFLSHSYTEDLHRQYFQKAGIISDNLGRDLGGEQFNNLNKDEINTELYALATATDADINLYLPDGKLMATNQPAIFDKKILTNYLHPEAYASIIESKENRFLQTEQVGDLQFKTVYLALKNGDNQELQAIIAIPFFESEEELNLMITEVFSNILIIFVLIFLFFLVISYFVSKNLTHPFKLLTQKLKDTDLENNEYMVWPGKDEIGLLVNEYNNMLYKLETSKKVLASNEKESAWREMAKQVAHEIKNPLTPMKLTLQHLLRLQAADKLENGKALVNPINSIIHQVDTLSDIASSFSTFAKMPLPKNQELEFRKVVLKAVSIFNYREDVEIEFTDHTGEGASTKIMGDPKLYGRVISNLIINGIQAVVEGKKPIILVNLYFDGEEHIKLSIKDNGKGISDELKEKVFLPNFSTKSEGSGLGLAIAKRGVETAGGKIWFETSSETGTTFYLLFPLIP